MIRHQTSVLVLGFLFVAIAIVLICTFKILDRDFWWHIKAGEIMWNTGDLIKTDPFAYTRAGQPYLSSHQWLAQIIFYQVWNVSGATGAIFFRGFLVAAAFTIILLIRPKNIWPNGFLVLAAAYMNRPSFMDRPQLFSFVFFACFLYAAFQYLRKADGSNMFVSSWRRWLLLSLVCVQILWVNTHGAAAIYGIIVICCLFAQRIVDWFASREAISRTSAQHELKYVSVLLCALVAAALISPNGLRTFSDLFVYTSDQTLSLVREWQPRGVHGYLVDVGPFILLAGIALCIQKRNRIFSCVLIGILGYLSLQSYRHGMFFIFSCIALAVYALGDWTAYTRLYVVANKWPFRAGVISITLLGAMAWYARYQNISVLQREGYSGYGVAAVAEGAYDFIEKNTIQGKMFNTYAIGNYLLYRGYPSRLVYMDGRNIDYGYDFLREATRAGFDPLAWSEIEKKYGFTYAIIEYPLAPGVSSENDLPYVVHLSQNTQWALVYIDDKVAVYVKRLSEYKNLISGHGYKYITPAGLEFGRVFDGMKEADIPKAEAELERASADSATSIKAKLLLARHYTDTGNYDAAMKFANDAVRAQPYRPESFEALGIAYAGKQEWAKAGELFERSMGLTGGVGLPINYEYLSGIFAKAGDSAKATKYHQKATANPL